MKEKRKISAKIMADSVDSRGNRITTYLLTMPRFIWPEVLTHRMFSRNAASSRAIPYKKMVKSVMEDPFIPIAWQKDHKGMQGVEYFDKTDVFTFAEFLDVLDNNFEEDIYKQVKDLIKYLYIDKVLTLDEWWLEARNNAVISSMILSTIGVTKQLANRVLEPFLWYTTLVTATEYDNFFELRCPQYTIETIKDGRLGIYKSKKDAVSENPELNLEKLQPLSWLLTNTSHAEIHIQALAEAMLDARNESKPKTLEAGEWHIPFGDAMDNLGLFDATFNLGASIYDRRKEKEEVEKTRLKVATARCARLSYETHDGEIDYEKDIKLHDQLLERKHASCFEHCAKVMSDKEFHSFTQGEIPVSEDDGTWYQELEDIGEEDKKHGWCRNFLGFIPYRHLVNL